MYEQHGQEELEHGGKGRHRTERPARGAFHERGSEKARGQLQDPARLARPAPEGRGDGAQGQGPDAQVKSLASENKQLREALAEMALQVELLKKLRSLG